MVAFIFFKKVHRFVSKHFKSPEKTKGEPLVIEQGLFVDAKQPFYSKEFINGTKENQTKTKNFVHHPQNSNEMFCLQKLKNFDIRGSIGGSGEKDKLPHPSLAYQIQNGRKAGYNDNEICAGVTKSIAPGNYLKSYLEKKPSLYFSSLIQIMRSHFSEKDSSSTLTEMSNSVQSVNDSTYDFVMKLMSK